MRVGLTRRERARERVLEYHVARELALLAQREHQQQLKQREYVWVEHTDTDPWTQFGESALAMRLARMIADELIRLLCDDAT